MISMLKRLPNWLKATGATFFLGALLGGVIALAGQPQEPVFITDNWSYIPEQNWWLHATMVGLSLTIIMLAYLAAIWIVKRAFAAGLLIMLGGLLIGGLGLSMLGVALWVSSLESSQQIMFLVMGGCFVALSVMMLASSYK